MDQAYPVCVLQEECGKYHTQDEDADNFIELHIDSSEAHAKHFTLNTMSPLMLLC